MTPEEFEKLDPAQKEAEIERHNETERVWYMTCRKCGFRTYGTRQELRGKLCGACGHG